MVLSRPKMVSLPMAPLYHFKHIHSKLKCKLTAIYLVFFTLNILSSICGAEKNFTEVVELLHVPLQTLYNAQPMSNRHNRNSIENGHSGKN